MTNDATENAQPGPLLGLGSSDGLGPMVEPVTLADVLDALNLFNRPKPSEDDGPWEGGHYIRVDHLPAFINVIAAAWFAPEAARAAERERMIADGWRQTRYVAPVTDCEACLTPDACAIRGQCAHYLRERG